MRRPQRKVNDESPPMQDEQPRTIPAAADQTTQSQHNASEQTAESQQPAADIQPQPIFVESNASAHDRIAIFKHLCEFSCMVIDEVTNMPTWIMRVEPKRVQKLTVKLLKGLTMLNAPICTYTVLDKHEIGLANQRVLGNAPDAIFRQSKPGKVKHGNGTKSSSFIITHETTVAWRDAIKHVHSIINPSTEDRPRYCGRVVIEYQLVSKTKRDGFVFDAKLKKYVMDCYDVCLVYWRTTKEEKAIAKIKREKSDEKDSSSQYDLSEDESSDEKFDERKQSYEDDDLVNETRPQRRSLRSRKNIIISDSEESEQSNNMKPMRGTNKRSRQTAQLDDNTSVSHMQRRSRRRFVAAESDSDATIDESDQSKDDYSIRDRKKRSREDDVVDDGPKVKRRYCKRQSDNQITSSDLDVTSDTISEQSGNDNVIDDKLLQCAVFSRLVHKYVPKPTLIAAPAIEQTDSSQSTGQSDDVDLISSSSNDMSQSNNQATEQSDNETLITDTTEIEYDLQSFRDLPLLELAPSDNQVPNESDDLLFVSFVNTTWENQQKGQSAERSTKK